jgi:uncharacterized protein (DUF302 family)
MLYYVDSERTVEQVKDRLVSSAQNNKFGVLAVHNIKEKMKEKGVDYSGECVVVEVCSPHMAKEALEALPEFSTMLPCRISVYKTQTGKTRVATIRPSFLVDIFKAPQLTDFGREVEEILCKIIKEAV